MREVHINRKAAKDFHFYISFQVHFPSCGSETKITLDIKVKVREEHETTKTLKRISKGLSISNNGTNVLNIALNEKKQLLDSSLEVTDSRVSCCFCFNIHILT